MSKRIEIREAHKAAWLWGKECEGFSERNISLGRGIFGLHLFEEMVVCGSYVRIPVPKLSEVGEEEVVRVKGNWTKNSFCHHSELRFIRALIELYSAEKNVKKLRVDVYRGEQWLEVDTEQ